MIAATQLIDTEIYLERENLKDFYKTPTGLKVLSNKILMSGLLSEIVDEKGVMAHNLCIKELEQIGILDEEGLVPLLKYLLEREPTKRPEEQNQEILA